MRFSLIAFLVVPGPCYLPAHGQSDASNLPVWITLVPLVNQVARHTNWPAKSHASARHWTIEGPQPLAGFGLATSAGDLNGDGFSDLVIGAGNFRGSVKNNGAAFVFHGSSQGLADRPSDTVAGELSGSLFADSVTSSGDINGDGLDDLMVCAPNFAGATHFIGRVLGWKGARGALLPQSDWHLGLRLAGNTRHQDVLFGKALCVGDVNGDSYQDVIASAPRLVHSSGARGAVFVYLGSAAGLSVKPDTTIHGTETNSYFGSIVASVGDVNGDGFGDIAVGLSGINRRQASQGRVELFLGSATGLATNPSWTVKGPELRSRFGGAVAAGGDLNEDGYADILIGAPGEDRNTTWPGMVFAYFGSSNGPNPRPDWSARGSQPGGAFGRAIAPAGDVNGDGHPDVLIGTPYWSGTFDHEGRVELYLGTGEGLETTPSWIVHGGQKGALSGWTLSRGGDINHDGFADFIASTHWYRGAQRGVGRVDVFYGAESGYRRGDTFPVDDINSAIASTLSVTNTVTPAAPQVFEANIEPPPVSPQASAAPFSRFFLAVAFVLAIPALMVWRARSAKQRKPELDPALIDEVRAEERQRIARDLHDDLGPQISLLNARPGHADPDAVREILLALDRAVWSENPANDTLENFVTFLGDYAEETFQRTSIRCRQQLDTSFPDRHLTPDIRKSLLLSVKEALGNVLKHSGATEVWLRVTFQEQNLLISITDNGRGWSSGSGDSRTPARRLGGNGLRNMRERIESIGGRFDLREESPHGTRVEFTVALPDED